MSDRIQLNLRFDRYKDLYEAVKAKAKEQDVSINEFVVNALKVALGWETRASAIYQRGEALEVLEARLEERLAVRLAEIVDERVEQAIAGAMEATLGESRR